jgi:hypothetical protein
MLWPFPRKIGAPCRGLEPGCPSKHSKNRAFLGGTVAETGAIAGGTGGIREINSSPKGRSLNERH